MEAHKIDIGIAFNFLIFIMSHEGIISTLMLFSFYVN